MNKAIDTGLIFILPYLHGPRPVQNAFHCLTLKIYYAIPVTTLYPFAKPFQNPRLYQSMSKCKKDRAHASILEIGHQTTHKSSALTELDIMLYNHVASRLRKKM